ncbi:MAG: cupin domain-containing protein [Spirochaetales bacterium]|nr:cupin domain-containing protein [Spirochaetales bacterium]
MGIKYKFGEKLREVRERKGLTLKQVAASAGLTESMISQIERNKVSPSIDTLMTLAEILELDFDYLFTNFKKEKKAVLIHEADRKVIMAGTVKYEQLSVIHDPEEEHSIEAFLLSMEPEGEKGERDYGHAGRELGFILQGTGELEYGNATYQLGKGDAISFSSGIPHKLINRGKTVLKAVWISTPPRMEYLK